ncbi:hypothetical protein Afil01_45490 [Actinorhabdospora filicis]|uniref:Uncharacterized protein n=1 Tax=Actinorhabdospora filicis TaxID=1785913 RepID=A0A9W6SPZ0_9ACTN|nr:hypothetical protein Afil01_45490 [Actinorhabdospora filicis]
MGAGPTGTGGTRVLAGCGREPGVGMGRITGRKARVRASVAGLQDPITASDLRDPTALAVSGRRPVGLYGPM